jgi:hypothetical protein
LPVDARFCTNCGVDLRAPSFAETPPTESLDPPVLSEPSAQPDPPKSPDLAAATMSSSQPPLAPPVQPVALEAAPSAGGGNNALRIGLVVLLLVVLIGIGLGVYFVSNMDKIKRPVAPVESVAPLPGSETLPESEEAIAPSVSDIAPETTPLTSEPATPRETPPDKKPAAPKPETTVSPSAGSESRPEPQRPRTCDGLIAFPALLCRTEGPTRFWRCAPDGVNWNNNIPGCRRDTGRNNGRLY